MAGVRLRFRKRFEKFVFLFRRAAKILEDPVREARGRKALTRKYLGEGSGVEFEHRGESAQAEAWVPQGPLGKGVT